MKNKKAEITSEEIVKIILAVIGISLLLYLGSELYGVFTIKAKFEQIKSQLDSIENIRDNLEEGEIETFLIESPRGWGIAFFYDLKNLPDKCNGKVCLCFCKPQSSNYKDLEKGDLSKLMFPNFCNEEGTCRFIGENIDWVIGNEKNKGRDGIPEYISLKELPKEIFIKKLNDRIIISDNAI